VNTYPVEHQYDEAGRMISLKTFRTLPGAVNWASATWPNPPGGDVTQWVYDSPSGLLERKIYADAGAGAKTIIYAYDAGHFLDTKLNGRGQASDYTIDAAGRLRTVTYSDGAPSATLDYDRAGRLRSITDGSGTRTLAWNDRSQPLNESYTSGMLAGMSVNRTYDSQFRLDRLELKQSGVTQTRQRFAYDSISWLDYIADETPDGASVLHRFDYTFKTNTPFVESVAFSHGATMVMTQSYSRDSLGRPDGAAATLAGGASASGVTYQFDQLNRRTNAALADGTKWDYGYNSRSEVTSGKKKLASGAFEGGKQFEYGFDDIGNRTVARFGGDAAGNNLREADYGAANELNQLTTREVPGSIWLTGEAPTNLTLLGAVDGHPFAVQRQEGGRFFGEATADNANSPVFARLTVAGKEGGALSDVETGHEYVARTPEVFLYDADGNLVSDGRWTNTWDCESRLIAMESLPGVPDAARKRLEFKYDYQGRRVQKVVSAWNTSTLNYQPSTTNLFVYDGWNLLATLDAQLSTLNTFRWGLDLSGTMQGAGGVGGLLVVQAATNGTHFPTFDGNGNVLTLHTATNGALSAQYEYGPFGELSGATGPMAHLNAFRFSTKYQDEETGFLYYGYRYLDCSSGRWMSCDPMEEKGGVNLYAILENDTVNTTDMLGLWKLGLHEQITEDAFRGLKCACIDKKKVLKGLKTGSKEPDIPDGLVWTGLFFLDVESGFFSDDYIKDYYGNWLSYRSHYGDLQWWHAMHSNEKTALEIQEKIIALVLGSATKFSSLAKTDPEQAGNALGFALHTIEDSYSKAHTVRNADWSISQFQNYGQQDSHKHGGADKEKGSPEYQKAVDAVRGLLNLIICDKANEAAIRQYLAGNVLSLNGNASVGGSTQKYQKGGKGGSYPQFVVPPSMPYMPPPTWRPR
jgi:RHS repeat-associated protein